MNLSVLKKSRIAPRRGDIFAMLPPGGAYIFGRVIATDARIGPMPECVLIYIYKHKSYDRFAVPDLRPDDLLVPPMLINKLPWTKGYFENVSSVELHAQDKLAQHCFVDSRGWYFDEYNNRLAGPLIPFGERGLHSFRTIDDAVSSSLGIPLSK